jgi:hypothetical protein
MKLVKIIGPIGVFIAIVISLLLWWVAPHVPSDQALEKQFYRQRPSLERLTAMLAEDSRMTRIAPDFLWTQDTAAWPRPESNWGISRFRWDEYKSLFNQAGIAMGVENRGNSKEAILIVYTWGIVPSGVSVGYLHCGRPDYGYLATEPACVEQKDSGSGMYTPSTSFGYRYKKITEDWFILEQSN